MVASDRCSASLHESALSTVHFEWAQWIALFQSLLSACVNGLLGLDWSSFLL
jgi:hypothetical protein